MKVVFVSNYLTHHQLPFCHAMNAKLGSDFCFMETEEMTQERIELGWQLKVNNDINIMRSYIDDKTYQDCCEKINKADAVIIGGTKDEYIEKRLKENGLIFRYEERIFKKSWLKILDPRTVHMIYATHVKNQKKRVYMLCASAYLPQELKLFHLYKNKMFMWGYFPETYHYSIDELMKKKKHEITEILWCARFIDWKHPEKVIAVAEELVYRKLKFHITMLGDGALKATIKKKISKKNLDKYISLKGAIPATEVRNYMETANIFLATSDRNEGWGAVINEAMNSGCAVVANRMMGAVPYLIQDRKNGYIYKNKRECCSDLKELLEKEEIREAVGISAYRTIVETWNAEKAAENLLELIKEQLGEECVNIPLYGPVSGIS